MLILGLAHNIQVEGDGIDQISRHQILLLFPDHHHYHSFIIKGSDKTTSFRPHHASFRQILKYPINFLSGSKIVVVHINLSVSKLRYIRNDEVCLSQKISAGLSHLPCFAGYLLEARRLATRYLGYVSRGLLPEPLSASSASSSAAL